MFPKKGKVFPGGNDRENATKKYASMVAGALRSELGTTHRAAKAVMRWTGASERTVKHWLSGGHGPAGEQLIVLMCESETVFEAVLTAANRRDVVAAVRVLEAHGTMVEVMAMVERARAGQARVGPLGSNRQEDEASMRAGDPESDRVNDRVNDRVKRQASGQLNLRQRWYLEALEEGQEVRAADLQRRWGVSEMTARRDIAVMKALGKIEFTGSFKVGRYRLKERKG